MASGRPKIIVVDDEETICSLLYHELSEQGYECMTASDGGDALAVLATADFDLVLLDIKLPGMSGMQLLRSLRSNHPDTAAIMLTAVNEVDIVVEAMKLGAADYIVKPFSLDRINASVHAVLERELYSVRERGGQTWECVDVAEGNDQPTGGFFQHINAIASGVEASCDMLISYSRMVTEKTIQIARQLDIPDVEIQRWAATRTRHDSLKNDKIRSSLDKLRRSPVAQAILGVTQLHLYEPNECDNEN